MREENSTSQKGQNSFYRITNIYIYICIGIKKSKKRKELGRYHMVGVRINF